MAQCVRMPALQEQLCCARREACTRYRDLLSGPQGVTVPGTFRMSNVVTMEPSREARTGGGSPVSNVLKLVRV